MYLYFGLEHFQTRPSELLQLDHFNRISLVDVLQLHTLVDVTREALPQDLVRVVLVLANQELVWFEEFLCRLGSAYCPCCGRGAFEIGLREVSTVATHDIL